MNRVVKMWISFVYWQMKKFQFVCERVCGRPVRITSEILMYHEVKLTQRVRFARQMDELLKLAVPVCLNSLDSLKLGRHHVAVTFDDGLRSVRDNALPELKRRNIPATLFVPTDLMGETPSWAGVPQCYSSECVMNEIELSVLSEPLVQIESHCRKHVKLTAVSDIESEYEISESKAQLERILNSRVNHLAFPYGAFGKKHLSLAKNAGYSHAYAAVPCARNGILAGRIHVSPDDSLLEFRLKALGAYRWQPYASDWKRKIRNILFLTRKKHHEGE